ncbi:hypothetical protein GOBAR_AA13808 [Gossypium barbadense]|uniref:Retrotransposon Copia-like N-terminal domain-containing protein n=1 Tax=Gossypium barbadense TaxID=3634 RepID=A0A2P5XU12_GOSBA|nr:hypothetical protein GOBAR_AA13808 [Gossypium barbadense]
MESVTFTVSKSFNPLAFASQKVVTLVDDCNFLAWKQHVLLVIKTHRLHYFLDGTVLVPSSMVSDENGSPMENPEFIQYEQQDAAISVWLLSIVGPALHN